MPRRALTSSETGATRRASTATLRPAQTLSSGRSSELSAPRATAGPRLAEAATHPACMVATVPCRRTGATPASSKMLSPPRPATLAPLVAQTTNRHVEVATAPSITAGAREAAAVEVSAARPVTASPAGSPATSPSSARTMRAVLDAPWSATGATRTATWPRTAQLGELVAAAWRMVVRPTSGLATTTTLTMVATRAPTTSRMPQCSVVSFRLRTPGRRAPRRRTTRRASTVLSKRRARRWRRTGTRAPRAARAGNEPTGGLREATAMLGKQRPSRMQQSL